MIADRMVCVELDHEKFGHLYKTISEQELLKILKVFEIPFKRSRGLVEVLGPTYQFNITVAILQ